MNAWFVCFGHFQDILLTRISTHQDGRDSVSNHQLHDCLPNSLFRGRSKKTSKFHVTGLCAGNSPGTGEFPAQMASNVENVSIWWRHHDFFFKELSLVYVIFLGTSKISQFGTQMKWHTYKSFENWFVIKRVFINLPFCWFKSSFITFINGDQSNIFISILWLLFCYFHYICKIDMFCYCHLIHTIQWAIFDKWQKWSHILKNIIMCHFSRDIGPLSHTLYQWWLPISESSILSRMACHRRQAGIMWPGLAAMPSFSTRAYWLAWLGWWNWQMRTN